MKFIRPVLAVALVLGSVLNTYAQAPSWTKATPAAVTAAGLDVQLTGCDYGNSTFVLATYFGGSNAVPALTASVFTSPDGVTWTRRTLPVSGRTGAPRFLNGKFFLGVQPSGPGNGVIVSSSDGITWTATGAISSSLNAPSTFAFGNGVYAGSVSSPVPGTNQVVTSTDGVNWTPRSLIPTGSSTQITFFGGKLYATAYNYSGSGTPGGLFSSTDGVTWTRITTAPAGPGILSASGAALLVSTFNSTVSGQAVSPDGAAFTTATPGIKLVTETIRFLNGAFVVTDTATTTSTDLTVARASYDGHTWTAIGSTTNLYFATEVAYGNGRYVFVGEFDLFSGTTTVTPGGVAPAVTTPPTTTTGGGTTTTTTPGAGSGSTTTTPGTGTAPTSAVLRHGGGGGAPSVWFFAALALLGSGRRLFRPKE